jgi:hypothetical protein
LHCIFLKIKHLGDMPDPLNIKEKEAN